MGDPLGKAFNREEEEKYCVNPLAASLSSLLVTRVTVWLIGRRYNLWVEIFLKCSELYVPFLQE
jgi:hypothetical protein